MRQIKLLAIAGVAFAAVAAQPASANVVTIGSGTAAVTCTPNCEGFIAGGAPNFPTGAGALSSTNAAVYAVLPADEATQASALSLLSGETFVGADGAKTTPGGGDVEVLSFNTLAAYVAVKLGVGTFFIKNTSGGELTIDFLKTAGPGGAGGGLSHYTEFGNEIPIPGALWLMGAGLAGLGFARRRKAA